MTARDRRQPRAATPAPQRSARPRGRAVKGHAKHARVVKLERQLAAAKEYLQVTIEEQEATNEELQSANEELLSSNEELQSINEELETAKEELTSSNEELSTANEELGLRNAELLRLNGDLDNLLRSGYAGRIDLVNLRHDRVRDRPAVRSVRDLGKVPDLALVASPPASWARVVDDLCRLGAGAAVLLSAGSTASAAPATLASDARLRRSSTSSTRCSRRQPSFSSSCCWSRPSFSSSAAVPCWATSTAAW